MIPDLDNVNARVEYIDYASDYFSGQGQCDVPARCKGKFVLVRGPAALYAIFSPAKLDKYHAHIVERFCTHGPGPEARAWDAKREMLELHDDGWAVLGGGKFELDADARTLALGGQSMAYGAVDLPWLVRELASVSALRDYTIIRTT